MKLLSESKNRGIVNYLTEILLVIYGLPVIALMLISTADDSPFVTFVVVMILFLVGVAIWWGTIIGVSYVGFDSTYVYDHTASLMERLLSSEET